MVFKVPGVKRHKELNGGAPSGWKMKRVETLNSRESSPDREFLLVGIISTWNDADIIEANVKNCLNQGFDRVLILDNMSSDGSVEASRAAGAEISEVYLTQFYDDDLRIAKENAIAKNVVENTEGHVWIVSLDADEFIHGSDGKTVKESLRLVPDESRTVGSLAFDLYPESKDQYIIGSHPAKCIERGILRRGTFCNKYHWKHAAISYHGGVFDIAQTRGNHSPAAVSSIRTVFEPEFSLPIIHCPFRRYEDSKARLQKLCGKSTSLGNLSRSSGDDQVTGGLGAVKRWQCLEDVYAGRWDRVEIPHCKMLFGRQVKGICLYPWRKTFPDLCVELPE
jgi:hypothetical protein